MPSARVVNLRDYNEHGFQFLTNLKTCKAADLVCDFHIVNYNEYDNECEQFICLKNQLLLI